MAKVQKSGNGKQVHNMNTPEKIEAIKAAIIAGETPRAIHEKFGTSIVNVHYHKAQLRKHGLLGDAKSSAGKKVSTSETAKKSAAPAKVAKKVASSKPVKATKSVKASAKVAAPKKAVTSAPATSGKGVVSVVVNGTKITTDKPVKSYKVSKKSVLIEF